MDEIELEKVNVQLQKWTYFIENYINFSFIKFGDGEFNCMLMEKFEQYEYLENCDGHSYSFELGEKLINSYDFLTTLNNIYIGNWNRDYDDLRKKLTRNKEINFVNFEILLTRKLLKNKFDFFKTIKYSKRKKIYIGPERLEGVVKFLNIDKMITVPLKNCFLEYNRILEELVSVLKDDNIYLFSCSMPAKCLISDILNINQNITCLDIGSGFDIMFVGQTREGQNLDSVNFYKELLEN